MINPKTVHKNLEVFVNVEGYLLKGTVDDCIARTINAKTIDEIYNHWSSTYIVKVGDLKGEFTKTDLFVYENQTKNDKI